MNIPNYVKVSRKEWARELCSILEADLNYEDTENPAAQLLYEFVEWAAIAYAGEEVPNAVDLANTYQEDGEFYIRIEEIGENASDEQWEEFCKGKNCLFWDEGFACLTDGYCQNIPNLEQNLNERIKNETETD